jgi:hypothetical protein
VAAPNLGRRRKGLLPLEGARLIQARRGRIRVLDRAGLEDAAGDAYGPVDVEYERLIAPLRRRAVRPSPHPRGD